jgi:mono/diheme cytochrome c family protein
MLAAAIARSGDEPAVQKLFALVIDENRAGWQRSATLRGIEIATGALGGGGGRGGRGAAANDTGPGGRGAPEGDRAYPLPGGDQNSAVFFGANPPPAPTTIKMTREPVLVSFAARDRTELAARVTRVLTRVEWPGKPGLTRAAVAPLTTQEQQRFDSGRAVYAANCAGCHQADGRGLPSLAPALANSALVLGPASVTARIVLNGKEGAVGLMPPIGGTLGDEEVAAVLTYIRREWGNGASPIDAATAQAIRAMNATRTRPWTDDELARIGDGAVR